MLQGNKLIKMNFHLKYQEPIGISRQKVQDYMQNLQTMFLTLTLHPQWTIKRSQTKNGGHLF
jgi:hypothetical protein